MGISDNATKVIMNELVITKGAGKFIVLAAIVNIPFIGFIPYLTQAFTILFLAIFLKHMISDEEKISVAHSQKNVQYITKPLAKWLIYGTMAFQVLWIPYVMQLITLVALGIIYANFTKYKE